MAARPRIIQRKNLVLDMVMDEDSGAVFENLVLSNCTFDNCGLSYTTDTRLRSIVRNVVLTNCTALSSRVGPAILEDVTIDTLVVGDILILWGALFKHVTVKGKIGSVNVNAAADHIRFKPSVEAAFAKARVKYYQTVDWALDISQMLSTELRIRGVPARLIRRDPETQVVVTRERALKSGWRAKVANWNDDGVYLVESFLQDGEDDCVLIAPKGSRKRFKRELDALLDLRRIGVAEPD